MRTKRIWATADQLYNSFKARIWYAATRRKVPLYRTQLTDILAQRAPEQRVWIFPPGLNWARQLFQRPQQLALAFARQGELVFYVEQYASSQPAGFQQEAENLYLCHVPLATFQKLQQPFTYSLFWNARYLPHFTAPRIIYDYCDELAVASGSQEKHFQTHNTLLNTAHLVLATAERLYEKARAVRPDTILCPNGVAYQHFAPEQYPSAPPPSDLAPILALNKPIIGYYGALARWFDYNLLIQVAQQKPELSFVLIGPDHDQTLLEGKLMHQPNISWLGQKHYTQLPAYLKYFDVATIPFRLSEITHATSPLKLFEYMAGGKPVVITPMHESMRYEGVLVAGDAAAFAEKLDDALKLRDDETYQATLRRVALANTWDTRAQQILAALPPASLSGSNYVHSI